MNFASVSNKNWIFKKYNNNKALQISEKFSLKEITSRLLAIRNIEIEDINLFLNPTIKNTMPNPFKILDMQNAVSRTTEAINNKEKPRENYCSLFFHRFSSVLAPVRSNFNTREVNTREIHVFEKHKNGHNSATTSQF